MKILNNVVSAQGEYAKRTELSGYATQSDLANAKPDLSGYYLKTEVDAKLAELDIKLATYDTRLTSLETSGDTPYVLITDLSRKGLEVTVCGTGQFPVLVTIYGKDLLAGKITVDSKDYDIEDEYLYGSYTLASTSTTMPVSTETFDTELKSSDPPPNAHEHSVTVSGLTVDSYTYTLNFSGTVLTLVVLPDDEWVFGDIIEFDIEDIGVNNIYYVTAVAGFAND